MIRSGLREILRPLLPDEDDYKWVNDRYEYRVALMQHQTQDVPGAHGSAPGEFIGDWQWDDNGLPLAEVDFRATGGQAADDWPWWHIVGGQDEIDTTLTSLREVLGHFRRWG